MPGNDNDDDDTMTSKDVDEAIADLEKNRKTILREQKKLSVEERLAWLEEHVLALQTTTLYQLQMNMLAGKLSPMDGQYEELRELTKMLSELGKPKG